MVARTFGAKYCKQGAHWVFHNFFPALFWSGLVVNLSMLLFEETLEKYSCEEQHNYLKNVGKMLFLGIFFIRLILLPLLAKKLSQYSPCCPSENTVRRIETECNDGIETGVFVFESMKLVGGAPPYAAAIVAAPAVWPILAAIYKFINSRFKRGPRYVYKQFGRCKQVTFIVLESLYNMLSLASAMSFSVSLLFNVFYNSTHENPYEYQNYVMWPLLGVSAALGVVSTFGKRSWATMCYGEAFINTFLNNPQHEPRFLPDSSSPFFSGIFSYLARAGWALA